MKKLHTVSFLSALSLAALLLTPVTSRAQFTNGSVYLGPELGLGFGYGGGVVFGGEIEAPITNPGTVGSGRLAIAGRFDYWGWSDGLYSYSFIPITAYCKYHFVINDPNWDIFAGLGVGFAVVSFSYSGEGSGSSGYGGVFITLDGGVRYFVSPNVAIRGELSLLGYLPLAFGVDFKL